MQKGEDDFFGPLTKMCSILITVQITTKFFFFCMFYLKREKIKLSLIIRPQRNSLPSQFKLVTIGWGNKLTVRIQNANQTPSFKSACVSWSMAAAVLYVLYHFVE